MKVTSFVAGLLLAGVVVLALAEDTNSGSSGEPTGGLANLALRQVQGSKQAKGRTKLLFDAQATPPAFMAQETTSLIRKNRSAPPRHRPTPEDIQFFQDHFERLGADAQIDVAFRDVIPNREITLRITRYKSERMADRQWALQRDSKDHRQSARVVEREVLYTVEGRVLPGGVHSSNSVQLKEGRYLIEVSPAGPEQHDAGLRLAWQQAERIKQASEPSGASKPANQGVHLTAASRFAPKQMERHRRLASVADLHVRASCGF